MFRFAGKKKINFSVNQKWEKFPQQVQMQTPPEFACQIGLFIGTLGVFIYSWGRKNKPHTHTHILTKYTAAHPNNAWNSPGKSKGKSVQHCTAAQHYPVRLIVALKLEADTPIFTAHCVLYDARCQETQPIYSGGKTKSYQVNPILTLHNFYKTAGKTKLLFFGTLRHPPPRAWPHFLGWVPYAFASHF